MERKKRKEREKRERELASKHFFSNIEQTQKLHFFVTF